jgi:hypothetical protein
VLIDKCNYCEFVDRWTMMSHFNFRVLTYHTLIINSLMTYIPLTKPNNTKLLNKNLLPVISDTISYTNFAQRNFFSFKLIYRNSTNEKGCCKNLAAAAGNFYLVQSHASWGTEHHFDIELFKTQFLDHHFTVLINWHLQVHVNVHKIWYMLVNTFTHFLDLVFKGHDRQYKSENCWLDYGPLRSWHTIPTYNFTCLDNIFLDEECQIVYLWLSWNDWKNITQGCMIRWHHYVISNTSDIWHQYSHRKFTNFCLTLNHISYLTPTGT